MILFYYCSGVIKKEFLLSTQPVEGNWKISVTAAKVLDTNKLNIKKE